VLEIIYIEAHMFRMIVGVALTFILSGISSATAAVPIQGPEYYGNFEAVSTAGVRTPLERQRGVPQSKIRAFGYGGYEVFTEYAGGKSPVRFSSGDAIVFVVRSDQGIDPQSIIKLQKLVIRKNSRISPSINASILGLNQRNVTESGVVAFEAQKFGLEFFKITPRSSLPPGEYAISMGVDGFLFGVD